MSTTSEKPEPLQPKQSKKKRGPYKNEQLQNRVIIRHISGESAHKIHRKEGIDRLTVKRILSQPKAREILGAARSSVLLLMPRAIDVYRRALASKNITTAFPAATNMLKGTGVFEHGGHGSKTGRSLITKSDVELEMQRRIEYLALSRLSIEEVKILHSMCSESGDLNAPTKEEEHQVLEKFAKAIKETKRLQEKS